MYHDRKCLFCALSSVWKKTIQTEQTVNDTKKCQQTTNHTDKYYRISCAMADHADRTDVLIHVVIVDFISTTLFTFVIIQFALGLVDLLLLLQ